jgi:predicted TIM-barrel fold metal-dependent hydrolase
MVVDFHTHIFPQRMRQNRAPYFAGEPAFELLYRSPKARLAGADDLLRVMDAQGVDLSVVFGFPWRSAETFRRHNDYILEAVARYPGRLVGLCCLDPQHPGAAREVRRCIDGGLCGVGELAFYGSGINANILERLAPVMDVCRESGLPVLVHANEPVGHAYPGKAPLTLDQIFRLIKRFRRNTLVLAHWGGGIFFYNLLKKEVKETLADTYFDTAASPYLYDPAVYRVAVEAVGSGRILFGSDYPLLEPARYFRELAAAGLAPEDVRRIRGANAAALLGANPYSGSKR